jgi:putative addiction module CopG family antidote
MAPRGAMTITLRPELEKVITQAIQSGGYKSADEVIERALEVLRAEDTWLVEHKAELAEKLDRAFSQFERGDFLPAEQSRAEMEERKAAWLAEQTRDGVAVRRLPRGAE